MFIGFSVKNFRSLRDKQTLSMVSSTDRSHVETHTIKTNVRSVPRVNRAGVVYGANASGKSNLIFALITMRNLVLHSTMLDGVRAEQYTPYRLERSSAGEPTEFEVVVLLDGIRYRYGFSYDAQRIRDEWLIVYKTGKGQSWFERRWNDVKGEHEWAPFSSYFSGAKETWRQATRPGALFLTTAIQLNNEQLRPLWNWFADGLVIVNWSGALGIGQTLQRMDDPAFKARALNLLRGADLHLADIEVEHVPGHQMALKLEAGKTLEVSTSLQNLPVVKYVHRLEGEDAVALDGRFESAGTQRLLSCIGPILDVLEAGTLLVVDEFDSSLHPMVVRFVLHLFHDPDVSKHGAQLWMTTHDTSLLDTELLRRDQVWFVDKDERQASRLYPLTDFSPRKGEALEKGYLRARYGGVPFISRTPLH
ncbi:abortive infection protein [mine drainage metagenome]|uniref:Abortive infection protein n=1 Tax=mine drainage metagenome TaxID=410659 RepID=T0Y406_9ZZZZ